VGQEAHDALESLTAVADCFDNWMNIQYAGAPVSLHRFAARVCHSLVSGILNRVVGAWVCAYRYRSAAAG
jgi:hypothetical protein